MSIFKAAGYGAGLALVVSACVQTAPVQRYPFGKVATAAEIRGWDIDVRADGAGLPAGSGSVAQGRLIYEARCAQCHGASGVKGSASRLAGGAGTLADKAPVMTVGSFWPHATTLYDYINRAMPFDQPQSLTADQVYAVTAYTLNLNGIVAADVVLDAGTLAKIRMPNRAGFTTGTE